MGGSCDGNSGSDEPRVVELRVHGVSGTPPEDLLDRPLVRPVAGDKIAGFYRPRLAEEWTDDPVGACPGTGPYLEGYAWGGLTSGSPSRAFWLLLLPFTLINAVPRLRPAGPVGLRVKALIATSRLLALSLTVTFILAVTGVTIEVLARQCGLDKSVCQALPQFFQDWQQRVGQGGRLALASAAAIAFVVVLWLLSRWTAARYETVDPFPGSGGTQPGANDWDPGLDNRWLWFGEHMVRRQRSIHVSAGLVSVVAMVGLTLWHAAEGRLLFVVAIVALVVLGALLCNPTITGRGKDPSARLTAGLCIGTFVALVWAALVVAVSTPAPPPDTAPGPSYARIVTIMFGVQIILVLVLFVLTMSLPRTPAGGPPRRFRDPGAPALALLSVLLAAALSAGAYLYAWAWVRGSGAMPNPNHFRKLTTSLTEGAGELEVPLSMLVAAAGFAIALGWVLALLAILGLWTVIRILLVWLGRWRGWLWLARLGGEQDWANFKADYKGVPEDERRAQRIVRMFRRARLVDSVGAGVRWTLYPMGGLALALTGWSVAALWWPRANDRLISLLSWPGPGWLDVSMLGIAVYLVVLVPVAGVLIGLAMFRARSTRRLVGVLWDVASFWPRSIHPFAAPCYAERTVPDLLVRIRYHGSRTPGVVLAGHSQGSVIAAAVIRQQQAADAAAPQADAKVMPRVAFLSYGSMLDRLYGRYFPAYFGPTELGELATALGPEKIRWLNLWRHSDFLGGPITPLAGYPDVLTGVDVKLIDPPYWPVEGDPNPDPAAGGHSAYPRDQRFQARVADLVAWLSPPRRKPEEPDNPPTLMRDIL